MVLARAEYNPADNAGPNNARLKISTSEFWMATTFSACKKMNSKNVGMAAIISKIVVMKTQLNQWVALPNGDSLKSPGNGGGGFSVLTLLLYATTRTKGFWLLAVTVKLNFLDGKAAWLEADVAALVGLIPIEPADLVPLPRFIKPAFSSRNYPDDVAAARGVMER